MPATEVSQLVSTGPGFPVHLWGAAELHATFLEGGRTSLFSASAALQKIREAISPFVIFSLENHTSLFGHSNCETALQSPCPLTENRSRK